MLIHNNISLRDKNSFGFDVTAEYFCRANSVEEIREAIAWQRQKQLPLFILGGGSNTVFTRNISGLVLHIAIDKLHTDTTGDLVSVFAGAGINWHSLVESTVLKGQYGLENLALIPGNAGAAPIQNIGAYGKELCDNLISVDVLDQQTDELLTLQTDDCQFGYRQSLFKTSAGSKLIVLGIKLQLSTVDTPVINYAALREALPENDITAEQVFRQVCALRQSKLPDPAKLGNAGSFFKNPIVESQHVDTLRQQYPHLPVYPQAGGCFKLPAAWLIDQAGWKGHRVNGVGVHDRQALVLVNHGTGNGQQIAILAEEIRADIRQRYNIDLEPEPVIYQ